MPTFMFISFNLVPFGFTLYNLYLIQMNKVRDIVLYSFFVVSRRLEKLSNILGYIYI